MSARINNATLSTQHRTHSWSHSGAALHHSISLCLTTCCYTVEPVYKGQHWKNEIRLIFNSMAPANAGDLFCRLDWRWDLRWLVLCNQLPLETTCYIQSICLCTRVGPACCYTLALVKRLLSSQLGNLLMTGISGNWGSDINLQPSRLLHVKITTI